MRTSLQYSVLWTLAQCIGDLQTLHCPFLTVFSSAHFTSTMLIKNFLHVAPVAGVLLPGGILDRKHPEIDSWLHKVTSDWQKTREDQGRDMSG